MKDKYITENNDINIRYKQREKKNMIIKMWLIVINSWVNKK